jgi:hypothetical protein
MRIKFIIPVFLLTVTALLASVDMKISLAPFRGPAGEASAITSSLEKNLGAMPIFRLRQSDAVRKYMDSLIMAQAGLLSPAGIDAAGRSLAIDGMLVGSIRPMGGRYEADERLVNMDTWEIRQACGITAESASYAAEAICHDMKNTSYEKTESSRPVVAVYAFNEKGNPGEPLSLGEPLADMITSALACGGRLSVAEHSFVRALESEKVMEMSGIIERESPSAFAPRGIAFAISGTVTRLPGLITVSYRISRPGAAVPVAMGYRETGSVQGLRPVATDIARAIADTLAGSTGTFMVDILPADSKIYVDGTLQEFTGSLTLQSGERTLRFTNDGFEAMEKKIRVKPGAAESIVIRLKKSGGAVSSEADTEDEDGGTPQWQKRLMKESQRRDGQ